MTGNKVARPPTAEDWDERFEDAHEYMPFVCRGCHARLSACNCRGVTAFLCGCGETYRVVWDTALNQYVVVPTKAG